MGWIGLFARIGHAQSESRWRRNSTVSQKLKTSVCIILMIDDILYPNPQPSSINSFRLIQRFDFKRKTRNYSIVIYISLHITKDLYWFLHSYADFTSDRRK